MAKPREGIFGGTCPPAFSSPDESGEALIYALALLARAMRDGDGGEVVRVERVNRAFDKLIARFKEERLAHDTADPFVLLREVAKEFGYDIPAE